ncbi:hypothetical protein BLNAU_15427 [Blattamonas nauphoetae]|uniref:Uncharacterized protein n=1 Tax=Blattamonas nauphoetae TaxID=2049346 RepID=A0ABQ9XHA0_9EUKA|nr:hypothetical protein BLNAU_15427 [Blattamonas nauphoetae]
MKIPLLPQLLSTAKHPYLTIIPLLSDGSRCVLHHICPEDHIVRIDAKSRHTTRNCRTNFTGQDRTQSKPFADILSMMLQFASFSTQTFNCILDLPVVITFSSCFEFFEDHNLVYNFVRAMTVIKDQDRPNIESGIKERRRETLRRLSDEGVLDILERLAMLHIPGQYRHSNAREAQLFIISIGGNICF